jgi:hypothetical protein
VNTITAFFFGLLFIISISGIAFLLSSFNSKEVVKENTIVYPDLHLVKFDYKKIDMMIIIMFFLLEALVSHARMFLA